MRSQSLLSRSSANRKSLLSTFGKRFYVLLFCLSLLSQYAYAVSLSSGFTTSPVKGKVQVSLPDSHQKVANPFDSPLITEPDGEDSETGSDSDCGNDLLFVRSLQAESRTADIQKSSLSNFVSLILNREPVSLLILHHSWKSFLI